MGRRITRQQYARRAERSITLTTSPGTPEMIDQTTEAVRESVAPLADQVVRNAIGEEFRRAYDNAMNDLVVLAGEARTRAWAPLRPQRLNQVLRGEISE